MKLLIITQVVDKEDSNLGFFHTWIEEFAKHCESVVVICLREGHHSLPKNVTVLSLGKPPAQATRGAGRRLMYILQFYKYIFKYRQHYDAVFVHMNPEYVLLGSFLWKRWHKKVALWYAHKSNTAKLRKAVTLVDQVFTVSADSFPVATPKLKVVGHGIDTELFKPDIQEHSTQLRIITVGRVSQSKHVLEMFEVLDELYARKENFIFTLIGSPITETDKEYAATVDKEIAKREYKSRIHLRGALSHRELPTVLHAHDLFFNFGTTGNMDKAGLEALAVGVPVVTTNAAFKSLLLPYGLYVESAQPKDIADALESFMNRPDKNAVIATLHNKIVAEHSLPRLISIILTQLYSDEQKS